MNGNNCMKRFLLAVVLCFGMGVHVPVHGVGMRDVGNKIVQAGTFAKNCGNAATIAVPGTVVAAVLGMIIYNKWNARKAEEQKITAEEQARVDFQLKLKAVFEKHEIEMPEIIFQMVDNYDKAVEDRTYKFISNKHLNIGFFSKYGQLYNLGPYAQLPVVKFYTNNNKLLYIKKALWSYPLAFKVDLLKTLVNKGTLFPTSEESLSTYIENYITVCENQCFKPDSTQEELMLKKLLNASISIILNDPNQSQEEYLTKFTDFVEKMQQQEEKDNMFEPEKYESFPLSKKNERPKFMKLTDEDLTELGSIIESLKD